MSITHLLLFMKNPIFYAYDTPLVAYGTHNDTTMIIAALVDITYKKLLLKIKNVFSIFKSYSWYLAAQLSTFSDS